MKILFLIARYFPYSGLQTDFLRAAEAAADRGHNVTCLVGSWEGERPAKLKIITTDLPGTGEADDLDALQVGQFVRTLRVCEPCVDVCVRRRGLRGRGQLHASVVVLSLVCPRAE